MADLLQLLVTFVTLGVALSQPEYFNGNDTVATDVCSSMPCLNGGTCYGKNGLYTCDCSRGFTGKHCESALPQKCPRLSPPLHGTLKGRGRWVTVQCFHAEETVFLYCDGFGWNGTVPECPRGRDVGWRQRTTTATIAPSIPRTTLSPEQHVEALDRRVSELEDMVHNVIRAVVRRLEWDMGSLKKGVFSKMSVVFDILRNLGDGEEFDIDDIDWDFNEQNETNSDDSDEDNEELVGRNINRWRDIVRKRVSGITNGMQQWWQRQPFGRRHHGSPHHGEGPHHGGRRHHRGRHHRLGEDEDLPSDGDEEVQPPCATGDCPFAESGGERTPGQGQGPGQPGHRRPWWRDLSRKFQQGRSQGRPGERRTWPRDGKGQTWGRRSNTDTVTNNKPIIMRPGGQQ